MVNSVLNIIIKLSKEGGADKETVSGLYQVKRSILEAAEVTGVFIAAGFAVKKVLDETVGSLVMYAGQVRNVQNATGASAEDSSKLIQILDDQKISYEQLEKVIQKNGKAYDFSINGIANMSASYKKFGTTQDQAAFMQARFGKQWLAFVPVMQQGKQAILDAADGTEKNLILDQKAVDAARQYEIGMDSLHDSVEGLKISLGKELIPVTNEFIDGLNVYIRAQQIAAENTTKSAHGNMAFKDALAQATLEIAHQKVSLSQHADALNGDTGSLKDNAAALKEVSAANQSMLWLIGSIANETANYSTKQADLTTQMEANRAEAEKLYPWQKQQLDELNQKYADMAVTYDQNATAHNAAMGKIQYDLLVTKLSADGLTSAEYAIAQQAGLMYGVFDKGSIESAKNIDLVTQAINDGTLKVDEMSKAIALLPKYKSIDIVIKVLEYFQNNPGGYSNPQLQGVTGGYAAGGISTGPLSGHTELLHGTEAIIPLQNGSVPVQLQGAPNGGGDVYVSLTIASPMTVMDEQTARNTLLPFILHGVREAKARGAI